MAKVQQDKQRNGWLTYMFIAGILIVIGLVLIQNAYAVNMTAIDEIQEDLEPERSFDGVYSVFWLVFLLIILAVFMTTMFKMREDRETVFFAIASLIVSIMITLLLTSPLSFDYQTSENQITVEEITWTDGSITYNSAVKNIQKSVNVIPADTEFRLALSILFTGLTLFNGLYAMYIITNYHEGTSLNPNRR